jgi:hypothetical protein
MPRLRINPCPVYLTGKFHRGCEIVFEQPVAGGTGISAQLFDVDALGELGLNMTTEQGNETARAAAIDLIETLNASPGTPARNPHSWF